MILEKLSKVIPKGLITCDATKFGLPIKKAKVSDYAAWLAGFVFNGGEVTAFYDYDMRNIHVAKTSFFLPDYYGSDSIRLIVPSGLIVDFNKIGHNQIFYMDGFTAKGIVSVPIFNDVYKWLEDTFK